MPHRVLLPPIVAMAFAWTGCALMLDDLSSNYGDEPQAGGREPSQTKSAGSGGQGGALSETDQSELTGPGPDGEDAGGKTDAGSTLPAGCSIVELRATSARNLPFADGGSAWRFPERALADDSASAEVQLAGSGSFTQQLVVEGFSVGPVAANDRILGIQVRIDQSNSGGCVLGKKVALRTDSSERAVDPGGAWSGTSRFGGLDDLWGMTDVRGSYLLDPAFGVAIAARFQGYCGNSWVYVEAVSLSVKRCAR